MNQQRSIVYHFFPLYVQVIKKLFQFKTLQFVKFITKLIKNINFAHAHYVWVIWSQLRLTFFFLIFKS